jgi:hypothetical protein
MCCSSSLITREGAMCMYQVTEQVQINDVYTKRYVLLFTTMNLCVK